MATRLDLPHLVASTTLRDGVSQLFYFDLSHLARQQV